MTKYSVFVLDDHPIAGAMKTALGAYLATLNDKCLNKGWDCRFSEPEYLVETTKKFRDSPGPHLDAMANRIEATGALVAILDLDLGVIKEDFPDRLLSALPENFIDLPHAAGYWVIQQALKHVVDKGGAVIVASSSSANSPTKDKVGLLADQILARGHVYYSEQLTIDMGGLPAGVTLALEEVARRHGPHPGFGQGLAERLWPDRAKNWFGPGAAATPPHTYDPKNESGRATVVDYVEQLIGRRIPRSWTTEESAEGLHVAVKYLVGTEAKVYSGTGEPPRISILPLLLAAAVKSGAKAWLDRMTIFPCTPCKLLPDDFNPPQIAHAMFALTGGSTEYNRLGQPWQCDGWSVEKWNGLHYEDPRKSEWDGLFSVLGNGEGGTNGKDNVESIGFFSTTNSKVVDTFRVVFNFSCLDQRPGRSSLLLKTGRGFLVAPAKGRGGDYQRGSAASAYLQYLTASAACSKPNTIVSMFPTDKGRHTALEIKSL